jgi:predicted transcriptional regulator
MKVVGTTTGTPATGYGTVSDIVSTHSLQFKETDNAMDLAIELVTSHLSGAPVVGNAYEYVGFINEGDIIRAIDGAVDLKNVTAHEIMNTAFIGVEEGASLACVNEAFEKGLHVLPIVQNGRVLRCITRHDVLRARLGLGPTIDQA